MVNTGCTGGDPPDADELLLHSRLDAAVRRRRRRHWDDEEALVGLDVGSAILGSIGEHATLYLAGGHQVTGTIRSVGADVVEVVGAGGTYLVAAAAVAATDFERPVRGLDEERGSAHLADLAQDLVDAGSRLAVLLDTSAVLTGSAIAAGSALVLQTDHRRHVTIAWPNIAALRADLRAPDI